nr:hypothetical protein HK105_003632 [Polyrhizophydium stewartii]
MLNTPDHRWRLARRRRSARCRPRPLARSHAPQVVAQLPAVPAGCYVPCYTLRFDPTADNLEDLALSASPLASGLDLLLLLASSGETLSSANSLSNSSRFVLGESYAALRGASWMELHGPPFAVAGPAADVMVQIEAPADQNRPRTGLFIASVRLMPVEPAKPESPASPAYDPHAFADVKQEHYAPALSDASPTMPYADRDSIHEFRQLARGIKHEANLVGAVEFNKTPSHRSLLSRSSARSDYDGHSSDSATAHTDLRLPHDDDDDDDADQDQHHMLDDMDAIDDDDDEDDDDCSVSSSTGLKRKIYHCPDPNCDRVFSRPFNLKAHVIIHNPVRDRVHKCPSCPSSFCRSQDLLRHMQIHNRTVTFACPGCLKDFSRKDALRRHQRSSRNCPISIDKRNGKSSPAASTTIIRQIQDPQSPTSSLADGAELVFRNGRRRRVGRVVPRTVKPLASPVSDTESLPANTDVPATAM